MTERTRLTGTQARLLRLLRDQGPRSVAELGDLLQFSRSRIVADIAALRERQLLETDGAGRSRGGRPSSLVQWSDRVRFLGIDIGESSLSVALTNARLEIIERREVDADADLGPEATLTQAAQVASSVRAAAGGDVLAAGIGVPATVHFAAGECAATQELPGWERFAIRAFMTDLLGTPVAVDNDANVMALGEMYRGAARGAADVVFVKAGTGIRCGVVIGGHVHRGANGSVGSIGHVPASAAGPSCRCGRTGCLEAHFSVPALTRDAVVVALAGQSAFLRQRLERKGTLVVDDIAAAANSKDAAAQRIIRDGARAFGHTLAPLVDFINPARVVVGGTLAVLGARLLDEVRRATIERASPSATADLAIVQGELGSRAGEIGGAVLASDTFTSSGHIPAGDISTVNGDGFQQLSEISVHAVR